MRPSEYSVIPQDGDDVFTATAEGSQIPIKPEVYYGDGSFDPPSSDDEDDGLLEKNIRREGLTDVEETGLRVGGGHKVCTPCAMAECMGSNSVQQRSSSLRCLVLCLVVLVSTAAIIGLFAAFSYTGTSYQIRGTKHISIDHVFNGTFSAYRKGVRWIAQ